MPSDSWGKLVPNFWGSKRPSVDVLDFLGSRSSHFKLASAWLDAPIPADNWLLAGSLSESRLRLVSPAILNLQWPPLPVGNEFALLNREVLKEVGATTAGGSSTALLRNAGETPVTKTEDHKRGSRAAFFLCFRIFFVYVKV